MEANEAGFSARIAQLFMTEVEKDMNDAKRWQS